jgi:hypothetical protein
VVKEEELRLAGMLIDAADGKVDWTAYPDQTAQELKTLPWAQSTPRRWLVGWPRARHVERAGCQPGFPVGSGK